MKRLISILIVLVMLLCCACTQQEEEYEAPVQFFYPRVTPTHGTADSIVAPETREAGTHLADYEYLLRQYLQGPLDPQLYSPYPAETRLLDVQLDSGILYLTVNDAFAELTGIELTLACACLTRTALGLTSQASAVQITAESVQLDGRDFILMDESIVVFLDDAVETTDE